MPDDQFELNLGGDVVYRVKRKRGRPPFERTEENARKVNMLLSVGWAPERIARVIKDPRTGRSISVKTLRRHFSPELAERDAAQDQREARRLMRVWDMAESGNVGAERVLAQLIDRQERMEIERRLSEKPKAASADKLGKKQVDKLRARDAEADLMAELEHEAGQNFVRPN
ncbi:hypothetical protein DSD19_06235 [Rhodovulum sp. BSW8]|nr:hypothetical protein DSD19_06235 [Rhodovulum sp. BSW8]